MKFAGKQTGEGLEDIVAAFGDWVKGLAEAFIQPRDELDVQRLEAQLRDGGQALLGRLLQRLLQDAVDRGQEEARTCPHCGGRRRHQGQRRRRLRCSFAEVEVTGIYWKCSECGLCGHSSEGLLPQSMSRLLRGLVCLAGTALSSFHKGEVVLQRLLGVTVDDETIRRRCQEEGWALQREQDAEPAPVPEGSALTGSGDGTMVHTRDSGWREVKAYRLEHEEGCYGGAYLEPVEQFGPRVRQGAQRVKQEQAGQKVFLSDMAEWIKQMVARELPGWRHVADYWHACQHLHQAGEAVYGGGDPRARRWSRYWSRRLRWYGATAVADKLRRIVLHYRELAKQEAVLVLIRFLDKHAPYMDYPAFEAAGMPISSGPMESFCKQIGLRMKGPGMHWSARNVTPMAMLVTRWSLDPQGASVFGTLPAAA